MEWWERQSGNLTEKHAREIRRSLENHVLSQIGHLQITDITPKAIKDILLGIESEGKAETAHRIHQRVRSVFQYAVMQEWTARNPAADLHKLLAPVKSEPMKALPLNEFPDYLRRLDGDHRDFHLVTRVALKLMVMLFVRTRELIEAKWEELDLENEIWRIPAERMKLGVEHFMYLRSDLTKQQQFYYFCFCGYP